MDCAIAEELEAGNVNPAFLSGVKVGSQDPIAPSIGMDVGKVGRTSGLTVGRVLSPEADFSVAYKKLGIIVFTDQMLIEGTNQAFS